MATHLLLCCRNINSLYFSNIYYDITRKIPDCAVTNYAKMCDAIDERIIGMQFEDNLMKTKLSITRQSDQHWYRLFTACFTLLDFSLIVYQKLVVKIILIIKRLNNIALGAVSIFIKSMPKMLTHPTVEMRNTILSQLTKQEGKVNEYTSEYIFGLVRYHELQEKSKLKSIHSNSSNSILR